MRIQYTGRSSARKVRGGVVLFLGKGRTLICRPLRTSESQGPLSPRTSLLDHRQSVRYNAQPHAQQTQNCQFAIGVQHLDSRPAQKANMTDTRVIPLPSSSPARNVKLFYGTDVMEVSKQKEMAALLSVFSLLRQAN